MYALTFYVPEAQAEQVKEALFAVGAGRIGEYEACCWQTLGQGQYRPLLGANPAIGEVGTINQLAELKIEMVCEDHLIKAAVAALIAAHPYEEPAYHCVKVLTLEDL